MYAEIGRNTLDPDKVPSMEVLQQLQSLLAKQPGYLGYMALESDNAQRVFVRMWESEEAARAAGESDEIRTFSAIHIIPAVTTRELIGKGTVLLCDLPASQ